MEWCWDAVSLVLLAVKLQACNGRVVAGWLVIDKQQIQSTSKFISDQKTYKQSDELFRQGIKQMANTLGH
jgi:hypothetical protein